MGYVAYNRLYRRGRAITKPFPVTKKFKTMKQARKVAVAYNRSWNKTKASGQTKAKVVAIRKR